MKNKMMIGNLYLFLMFGVFPLFFRNYYYDIYQAKFWFTAVVTCIFFILCIIAGGIGKDQLVKMGKKEGMIWYLSFLFFAVVSVIYSQHKAEAFSGSAGRYNGLFIYLVYLMGYYVLFQAEKIKERMIYILEGTGILTSILGILNHFSVDPFGFTKGLGKIENFMSTLGNTSCFVEFIGMVMAIAGIFCILEARKSVRMWHTVVYVISFMALTLAGPETFYIALILFVGGAILVVKKKSEFLRYSMLIEYCCIVFSGISFIYHQNWKIVENAKYLSIITTFILNNLFGVIGIMIVFLAINAFIYFYIPKHKISERGITFIKRVYAGCIIGAGTVGVIVFIAVNNGWISSTAGLGKLFYLTDEWGTNRGYIWKHAMEYYKKMPVFNKLIGIGPDTIYFAYEEMNSEVAGAAIDNAHNMFLQLLITHGILGLAAWIGWVLDSLILCIKRGRDNVIYYSMGMGIICYYGMALFGVNMINSSAIAVLLMGLVRYDFSEKEKVTDDERLCGRILLSIVIFLILLASFRLVLRADETEVLNKLLAG